MFQGIKELKPHFFKHDCKTCFRAGLVKCVKCKGFGIMRRTQLDDRQSMVITAGSTNLGGASSIECSFCNGKGTEVCGTCQGQGWQYQQQVNYRKFQPKPMFEEYHRSLDRNLNRPRFQEKRREMKNLAKKFDAFDAAKQEKEAEELRLKREKKKLKKLEKEKGKGGSKKKDKNKA